MSSIAAAAEEFSTRPLIREMNGTLIGQQVEAAVVYRDRSQGRSDGRMSLTHTQMKKNIQSIKRFNAVPGATFKITLFEMGGAMPQGDALHDRDSLESFAAVNHEFGDDKSVGIRVLWRSVNGDGLDVYSREDRKRKLRRIAEKSGAKNTADSAGRLLLIRFFDANDDVLDQEDTIEMIQELRDEGYNIAGEWVSAHTVDKILDQEHYEKRWLANLASCARFPKAIVAWGGKDMAGLQKPGAGPFEKGYMQSTAIARIAAGKKSFETIGFVPPVLVDHMHEIEPDRAVEALADATVAFLHTDRNPMTTYRIDVITGRNQGFADLLSYDQAVKNRGIDLGLLPEQIRIVREEMEPQTRAWEDAHELPDLQAWQVEDYEEANEPSGAAASTDRILTKPIRIRLNDLGIVHYKEVAHRLVVVFKGWLREVCGHHGTVTPGALRNNHATKGYLLGAIDSGIVQKFLSAESPDEWRTHLGFLIQAMKEDRSLLTAIDEPKVITYFRGRLPKNVDADFMDHISFLHLRRTIPINFSDDKNPWREILREKYGTEKIASYAYAKARAKILAHPADKDNAEKAMRELGLPEDVIAKFRKKHVGKIETKRDDGVLDIEDDVRAQIEARINSTDPKRKITLRMPMDHAIHNAMLFGLDDYGNVSSTAYQLMQYPAKNFPFRWVTPDAKAKDGYAGFIDLDGRNDEEIHCIRSVLGVIRRKQRPIYTFEELKAADPKIAAQLATRAPLALVTLGLTDKEPNRRLDHGYGGSLEISGSWVAGGSPPGIRKRVANGAAPLPGK